VKLAKGVRAIVKTYSKLSSVLGLFLNLVVYLNKVHYSIGFYLTTNFPTESVKNFLVWNRHLSKETLNKGTLKKILRKENNGKNATINSKFSGKEMQTKKFGYISTLDIGYTVKKADGKVRKKVIPRREVILIFAKRTFVSNTVKNFVYPGANNPNCYKSAFGKKTVELYTVKIYVYSSKSIFGKELLLIYTVKKSVYPETKYSKMSKPESTPIPMDLDPFPPLGTKVEKPRGMRDLFSFDNFVFWSRAALVRYTWYMNVRGRKGYRHYGE
jgi:hypothetical protein